MKNFLKSLIGRFSPDVFKPVPEGLLYIMLQTISREVSGECPWDTNDNCYRGYLPISAIQTRTPTLLMAPLQKGYWYRKCRNNECPGYRHPLGLIAYISESDLTTGVDNRFDYSSFRFGTGNDWIPVGTLGCEIKFDFGPAIANSEQISDSLNVHIGDKWYIDCFTADNVLGTDGNYYKCVKDHTAIDGVAGNKPVVGLGNGTTVGPWSEYWVRCLFPGYPWVAGTNYATSSLIGSPIADTSNTGIYGPIVVPSDRGVYTGAHDTTYTVELIDFWGYVQNFNNAILQICLATADGEWLDFWGEYFGLPRLFLGGTYEDDGTYKARIIREIVQAKGTKPAILEAAKKFFNNDSVEVIEYHQTGEQPPDGPVTDPGDLAYGLRPYQFYIFPPPRAIPSAKFVRTNVNLALNGLGYCWNLPYGYSFVSWTTDGDLLVNTGDEFYFGYITRFSGLKLAFSQLGIGGTYSWKYWAGSWKDLTIADDSAHYGTSGFTSGGYINWKVPSDWRSGYKRVEFPDTTEPRFWVKAQCTAAPTTPPQAGIITITLVGQTCRGAYVGTNATYDPTLRDLNNCYIYFRDSLRKPIWQSGFQEIVDRIKTAGTICIINPR